MQPIFEDRGRKLIDALRKKSEKSEKREREIRGFEWLGESLLALSDQESSVFEVGHAFAARQPITESKVEDAARILGFINSPRYQSLSNSLWTLVGKTPISKYNEIKLYENPAFVTPDEEAFLRMRVTRNRSSEPLTFTQMFEDVCQYVRDLTFMKTQPEETVKRLVFENLFRDGRVREDIREMSSLNIGRLIGDNLWEQVKTLDLQKPVILTEAIVSSDVETTAQSQGADKETDAKYNFSPEEIQRLKDIFASGPMRYKPTVDNRLLKLSLIRYGKGGKHVEPVEGSWSDRYLDSGLLSSAEGPKKQTTQESFSMRNEQSGFVAIKCETPDEVDLVAEALDEHFEVFVDDQDPMLLKVRVYRTPNAEDRILSILKVAGLAGDMNDEEETSPIEEPVTDSRVQEAIEPGLRQWVQDYQDARHSGNVTLAKSIKKNIDKKIAEQGLDAHEVYFAFGDPDASRSESVIHLVDHPSDFLDVRVQLRNPDGKPESDAVYRDFLADNDDEADGIPREIAFMEPGEVRNIGGGAAPEMILMMQDKSGVWESKSLKQGLTELVNLFADEDDDRRESTLKALKNPRIRKLLDQATRGHFHDLEVDDRGYVNYQGDISLSYMRLEKIPVPFGTVGGGFHCSYNQLTSLTGAPESVGGYFDCSRNQLTSLQGAPASVGGDFYCYSNQLQTLEGAPESVGGNFFCYSNQLQTLEGAPKSVGGEFDCAYNQLQTLEGAPKSVGGGFYCSENPDLPEEEVRRYRESKAVRGRIYESRKQNTQKRGLNELVNIFADEDDDRRESTLEALKDPEIRKLLNRATDGHFQDLEVDDRGYVNYRGDINLSYMRLEKIPVPFGTVGGDFYCHHNQLQTLEGAPESVGRSFDCSYNQLQTLEGAPESVGRSFYCFYNQLQTLEGAPKSVGGDFNCSENPDLPEEEVRRYRESKAVRGRIFENKKRVSETDIALLAEEIIHYLKEPTLEDLTLRSGSGVSVEDLVERRLGRRSYNNEAGDHSERGQCHQKGSNAHRDMKLRKKIRMLLDKDKTGKAESKKA